MTGHGVSKNNDYFQEISSQSARTERSQNNSFWKRLLVNSKMDEAEAKSNVCSISCRPIDGGKSLLFGCGSVIKFSDQNLKVATSRKLLHVLSKESTKVEIIAKFEAQDQEIKLQFATEEESFENEDEGIVYMSFNATEFTGQLPNGLDKADLKEVDAIDCFVPVLENMKQFNGKNKFSFYKVVKETDKCSLEVEIGSNKRSFYSKCQFQEKHLEVLGSPILSKEYKFLGIVDFLEMEDNESLLRINYHDGIQKNFVKGKCLLLYSTASSEIDHCAPRAPGTVHRLTYL